MYDESIDYKKIRIYSFIMILTVGLCHLFSTTNAIDPDGVSYLDVAAAYLRNDFSSAINPYWSPLYSWIQGFFLYLFSTSMDLEPFIVHLSNFFIYIASYGCFYFFLESLIHLVKSRETDNKSLCLISDWLFLIIGNALFLWTSTNMITISILTPDMLVSGIVYLILGILIRIKLGNHGYAIFLLLGLVLGIGYLAKAFLFPLSIIFLIISINLVNNKRKALLKTILSASIFLVIAAPFIFLISQKQGYFTFGESGKLNLAWYMNDSYEYWRGGWPGNDELIHPSRKVYDTPLVYEYSEPIKGSYPIWYQPAYWFKGLKPHFNIAGEMFTIFWCLSRFFKMYIEMQNIVVFFAFFLLLLTQRKKELISDFFENWFLLLIPLIVYGAYMSVATELRYLGAFNTILWLGFFASLKFQKNSNTAGLLKFATIFLVTYLFFSSSLSYDMIKNGRNDSALTQIKVAKAVEMLGIKPGDKAGVIGLSYGIYWARLAQVRVAAEVPSEEEEVLWFADLETRLHVLNEFKKAGAKIAIAEKGPEKLIDEGWTHIKETPYYAYKI